MMPCAGQQNVADGDGPVPGEGDRSTWGTRFPVSGETLAVIPAKQEVQRWQRADRSQERQAAVMKKINLFNDKLKQEEGGGTRAATLMET